MSKPLNNNFVDDDLYPQYKVLLLGESYVGKTSILRNLRGEQFVYSTMMTFGVEFFTKSFNTDDGVVKLQIWDTAGQERFRCLTPQFYRDCKALIFVYDVTNYETFKNLKSYWLNNVYQNMQDDTAPCLFLVGNKSDSPARSVGSDLGLKLKEDQNFLGFIETSALTGDNIKDLFNMVAHYTHQHHKIGDFQFTRSGRQSIKLGQQHNDLHAAAKIELAKQSNCCSQR